MVQVLNQQGRVWRRRQRKRQCHALLVGASLCVVLVVGFTACVYIVDTSVTLVFSSSSPHSSTPELADRATNAMAARRSAQGLRNHQDETQHHHNNNNKKKRPEEEEKDDDAQDDKPSLHKEEILEQILQGRLQLIDLDIHPPPRPPPQNSNAKKYAKWIEGTFCKLDWSQHEQDPSQSPMFRHVVQQSNCHETSYKLDLYTVVQAVKRYHDTNDSHPVRILDLAGVVFHESRCGSTLVANLLQWHNPQENIVYSESAPFLAALRFAANSEHEHDTPLGHQVLSDVALLMSRSANTHKRRVFFKVQSMGTLYLSTFRAVFATTPWIFVYRDPVEVLMSHLSIPDKRRANCVASQRHPPDAIRRLVHQYSTDATTTNPRDLSVEDYCAAHLATLVQAALSELQQPQQRQLGWPVNYHDLPHRLLLPATDPQSLWYHWNLTLGPDPVVTLQRLQQGSTSYSKAGSVPHQSSKVSRGEFQGDAQSKQDHASAAIRRAAKTYLQPSYQALQDWETNHVVAQEQ